LFICWTDGVHGSYQMVQIREGGQKKIVYEGSKPSYDMSQFVPVPVSKGWSVIHWLLAVLTSSRNLNFWGRIRMY